MDNERIADLLTEVRDSNRQLLEEYRRTAGESLALQKQALAQQKESIERQAESIERQKLAVETQLKHVRLYRRSILAAIPVVVFLLWVLIRAMQHV